MLIRSIIKNWKLYKISKQLTPKIPTSIDELLDSGDLREKAIHKLFLLVINQKELAELLKEFKIDEKKFSEIYTQLVESGAAQWTKGNYVAASALAFLPTLKFILQNKNKLSWTEIAFSLLEYFKKCKTGEVQGC